MKSLSLSVALACLAAIPAAAQTEAERNLKAFPPAEEGMSRHVLMLPPAEQEDSLRVELQIGKTVKTDAANRYFFGGSLQAVNIEGWGFTCYVVSDLGPMGGTLMAVDPDAPKVDRFITLAGEPQLQRYNSRLPLVVHVSHSLEQPVIESARIQNSGAGDGIDVNGVVQLSDFSIPRLAVLAETLAKSAALTQQETILAQTLDSMEPVVAGLRSQGRITVSSRALLRLVGAALAARSHAAARIQPDDKPGLLWDYTGLEGLHLRLAEEFELSDRSAALDRKLTLIGETVETLLALIESRRFHRYGFTRRGLCFDFQIAFR